MVLNMASFYKMGGGCESGAMAEEEELFRRSNYFLTNSSKFYPFQKMECIYTPNVTIIKDENYDILNKPFSVSMLAVAAIKDPVFKNGCMSDWDFYVTCESIDNIFKVAILKGQTTLVLSALGCGAYNNSPEHISHIFNTYVNKYNGCFETIVFAVLSKHDTNFDIFKENIKLV
jgi:uncharacterized protein (TIGR02452 family)